MRQQLLHTPEGVRDIYNEECARKNVLQENLHQVMQLYGYRDIQTPTIEFFDVFSKEIGTTPSRELYKFFDREGNTLVLRPDITPSVARYAAKYFMDEKLPLRRCYMGNTFINHSSYQGRLKETTQMGAELIGDGSADADAEVIALVVEALLKAGLKDFQVSIGQIDFFKGLLEQAGIEEDTEEMLRELISNKNHFGIEELVEEQQLSEELKKGNSVRTAVKNGYKRAFSSVLDGNVTTAVVAGILMVLGSGTMLSFGYTLLTGVIINLLAGVWMPRYMLNSVIRYKLFNQEKWFRKKKEKKILKFAETKKYFFLTSVVLLMAGLIWSSVNGMKLDTQFTGGVILRYTYSGEADTGKIQKEVQDVVDRNVNVQTAKNSATGEKNLVITLSGKKGLTPEQQKEILNTINEGNTNQFETAETSAIEPYIGAKTLKNSAIAIVLSFLFIVVYIRVRFSALGGLASGVTAVIALLHDILIVLFIFGIFKIPVNDAFVAVTLTIIGYSINDTIVLYDRIREHRNGAKNKSTLAELVDISTTETLQRSINTAFTVVLCAFVIFVVSVVYGMESITNFSLPLLAGLISGCYSSICIAGPLWVWWEEHKERIQKRKTGRKGK